MRQKGDLVRFLEKQITIENQIAESLNRSLSEIGNPAVKGVLKGISLESAKHAEMYNSTIALMSSVSQALEQENLDKQKYFVEKHIKMEFELIEELTRILPSVEDEKVKLLLNSILMDKKRHLELLKQILEITAIKEAMTGENWQDIWWDMVWKDSRGSI